MFLGTSSKMRSLGNESHGYDPWEVREQAGLGGQRTECTGHPPPDQL